MKYNGLFIYRCIGFRWFVLVPADVMWRGCGRVSGNNTAAASHKEGTVETFIKPSGTGYKTAHSSDKYHPKVSFQFKGTNISSMEREREREIVKLRSDLLRIHDIWSHFVHSLNESGSWRANDHACCVLVVVKHAWFPRFCRWLLPINIADGEDSFLFRTDAQLQFTLQFRRNDRN